MHSVLAHVTCNRGSEFISHFFCLLGMALDMKLHFTSGYHPKCDGQTECTNQTLEQYIWVYCNYQQDNWFGLLLLMEFAYNNAPSVTPTVTLFYANKGYHLNLTIHPEWDLESSRAKEFVTNLNKLHQHLQEHTHGSSTTLVSRYHGCSSNPSSGIPDQESGLCQSAAFPYYPFL